MANVTLQGGWGYENVGDEAILAGYLEHFTTRGDTVEIVTKSTTRTRRAQRQILLSRFRLANERTGRCQPSELGILGGGGYLNGHWRAEIEAKLLRLRARSPRQGYIAHAVEARRVRANKRLESSFKSVFEGAAISVRDLQSARQFEEIGYSGHVPVLPDAISLLFPHIDRYRHKIVGIEDKIVVNLLDVAGRADASEAGFSADGWRQFCIMFCRKFSERVVGLSVGAYDSEFMCELGIPVINVATVAELVSVLDSARAVLSVRMHPALIATQLGKPTVAVPYCGKVRPTMESIGIEDALIDRLDVDEVLWRLSEDVDRHSAWDRAYTATTEWLDSTLEQQASAR